MRSRRAMNLRPSEFAPSEVDDGPSPYPSGTVGAREWEIAKAKRAMLRATAAGGGEVVNTSFAYRNVPSDDGDHEDQTGV